MSQTAQRCPLDQTADKGRQEDPYARCIDPCKCIRSRSFTGIDHHRTCELIQKRIDRCHQFACGQQEDEYQNKRCPCNQCILHVNACFMFHAHHIFLRRLCSFFMEHGSCDRSQQRTDRTDNDRQLTADKIRNQDSRQHVRQCRNQRNAEYAF